MEHKEYKSINKSVRKKDSMQLLLGKPVYTDDVTPRMLWWSRFSALPTPMPW